VLVLSNLAGAARELSSALLVNPYDTHAVGHAIQAALSMSLDERRERHAAMLQVLKRNDIVTWTRRFIEALAETQRDAPRSASRESAASRLRVVRSNPHHYRV
jgi:trehalose 6-phosphate synthase